MNLNRVPGKWLINSEGHDLPFWKGWLVRVWLILRPKERQAANELARLRYVLRQQPQLRPSPAALARIQARVRNQDQPLPATGGWPLAWLAAALVTFFGLLLLWQVVPPGVILEWKVESGAPQTFRVYRASASSDEQPDYYSLVGQVTASEGIEAYRYTDMMLLPGQSYVYRVEAIDALGQTAASRSVVGQGIDALPGQILVLALASVAAYAFGQLASLSWARWSMGRRAWQ